MPEQVKKRLEEEIRLLEYELTTELPAEIKKAVALGDLSENAEYHMAKQRQVFVNARLGQLKKRMGELAMVNLVNIPHDKSRLRRDRRCLRLQQERRVDLQVGDERRVRCCSGPYLYHFSHRPLSARQEAWRHSHRRNAEWQTGA